MNRTPSTLFNLGCGSSFAKGWRNFDISPISPDLEYWQADEAIPATGYQVYAIYHSHMLEHLNPSSGKNF